MKKIFFSCLFLALIVVGCDQTKDYLSGLNDAPEINFFENPNAPVLSDSIKLGLSMKTSQKSYHISLKVTDKNKNIKEVVYTQLQGQGKLFQSGVQIIDNNISIKADSAKLEFDYYPAVLGQHLLRLTVVDNFNLSKSVTIQITAFDNLPPVAVFNNSRIGQRDHYEYVINAGESYDKDERFGGSLYQFEFTFLGKIVYVLAENDHQLFVIFPVDPNQTGPLIFPVAVRVQDNDGRWSAKVSQDIQVN